MTLLASEPAAFNMLSRPAVASMRHGAASMGPGQSFKDRQNTFSRYKEKMSGRAAPAPAPAPAPARAARPARAPAGGDAYLKKDRSNLGGFNTPPPMAKTPEGEIDISNHPSAVKELSSFAAMKGGMRKR